MHGKAINPLQELIWATTAYLLWHGQAFAYPLGRSKVFPCFKTWQQPRISTDFYLLRAITCYGNQCRAAFFNSLWRRLHCRLRKLQWFITEPHCTASNAESIHTNCTHTHTRPHAAVATTVASNQRSVCCRGCWKTMTLLGLLRGNVSSRGFLSRI